MPPLTASAVGSGVGSGAGGVTGVGASSSEQPHVVLTASNVVEDSMMPETDAWGQGHQRLCVADDVTSSWEISARWGRLSGAGGEYPRDGTSVNTLHSFLVFYGLFSHLALLPVRARVRGLKCALPRACVSALPSAVFLPFLFYASPVECPSSNLCYSLLVNVLIRLSAPTPIRACKEATRGGGIAAYSNSREQ